MTMLEIMKDRLPEEAMIVQAKEKQSRFELILEIEGKTAKGSLPKTCSPGMAENVVDFSICTIMMGAYLEHGDLEKAKFWKNKQDELVHIK